MIENYSFENGWTDLPPAPGNLINQEPESWMLSIIEQGEEIFDSGIHATGIPECVHKHKDQLPPNEQPGGEDELILDGDYVYDIFHAGAKFGTQLSQVVTGLEPGRMMTLVVPVNCHFDELGGNEPDDIEVRVMVSGGDETRVIKAQMVNREWLYISATGVVDMYGEVVVRLRFIARWQHPRNFFVDNMSLTYDESTEPGSRIGDAREPYNRTYVRVNQNATIDEWMSIAEWAYANKYTIGFSSDDAGIGVGLSHKKIIEAGQEFDGAVIEAWYLVNYGVHDVEHVDYYGNTFD